MLNHKGTITLTTSRLTLRRFEVADAQAMFDNWANDLRVTRHLTWQPHGRVENTSAQCGTFSLRRSAFIALRFSTRRRIERACEYLRSSEIPISSLAVNVGFPDQNYFSRRFRAMTGLSPSAYRKEYRITT